jgi:hypothetical protein
MIDVIVGRVGRSKPLAKAAGFPDSKVTHVGVMHSTLQY